MSLKRKLENSSDDVLVSLVKCPLCSEFKTDYRNLPCGHSFCFECLDGWLKSNQSCPKDRIASGTSSAASLPKNYDRMEQAELFMKQQKTSHDGELHNSSLVAIETELTTNVVTPTSLCDGCDAEVATKYCEDCNLSYCDKCCVHLHELPRNQKHKIQPASYKSEAPKCSTHNTIIDFYCTTCNKLVCSACILCEHRSEKHKLKHVSAVADSMRNSVSKELKNVIELEETCKGITDMIEEISKQESCAKESAQKITDLFKKVQTMVQEQEQEAQKAILQFDQDRVTKIENSKTGLLSVQSAIAKYKKYFTILINEASPAKILQLHVQLLDSKEQILMLNQKVKEIQNVNYNLNEKKLDTALKGVAKSIKHLVPSWSKLGSADTLYCTFDGGLSPNYRVNESGKSAEINGNGPKLLVSKETTEESAILAWRICVTGNSRVCCGIINGDCFQKQEQSALMDNQRGTIGWKSENTSGGNLPTFPYDSEILTVRADFIERKLTLLIKDRKIKSAKIPDGFEETTARLVLSLFGGGKVQLYDESEDFDTSPVDEDDSSRSDQEDSD